MAPFQIAMTLDQVNFLRGCVKLGVQAHKNGLDDRHAGRVLRELATRVDLADLENLDCDLADQTRHEP
jgi:hypothetical protein